MGDQPAIGFAADNIGERTAPVDPEIPFAVGCHCLSAHGFIDMARNNAAYVVPRFVVFQSGFSGKLEIMSIWGKLAGAAAGFAIGGGPLGALFGGVAGHFTIDKLLERDDEVERAARDELVFTVGLIALCAKMAKADGVVTWDEVVAFEEVFNVPAHETQNVRRFFDQARQAVAGYESYAKQLANLFKDKPGVLEDVLDALFHIALADNVVHPKEIEYLENVAAIFGFSALEFQRIRASHLGPDAADPYVILGVEHDISDKDLKSTYRRLVKENHPDALIGRGVPEEFIGLANEKLSAINTAYDRIAKDRKLK